MRGWAYFYPFPKMSPLYIAMSAGRAYIAMYGNTNYYFMPEKINSGYCRLRSWHERCEISYRTRTGHSARIDYRDYMILGFETAICWWNKRCRQRENSGEKLICWQGEKKVYNFPCCAWERQTLRELKTSETKTTSEMVTLFRAYWQSNFTDEMWVFVLRFIEAKNQKSHKIFTESLILAQDKRWRRA